MIDEDRTELAEMRGKAAGLSVGYQYWIHALPLADTFLPIPLDESCMQCYQRHFPRGDAPYKAFSSAFHAAAMQVFMGLQDGKLSPHALYQFMKDSGLYDMTGFPAPPY